MVVVLLLLLLQSGGLGVSAHQVIDEHQNHVWRRYGGCRHEGR